MINSGVEVNENVLKLVFFYNGCKCVFFFCKVFYGCILLVVEVIYNLKIIVLINDNGYVIYLFLNDIEVVKVELVKGDVCVVIIEGI